MEHCHLLYNTIGKPKLQENNAGTSIWQRLASIFFYPLALRINYISQSPLRMHLS